MGQHLVILKKLSDPAARLYYLVATARFGWSRNVLLNQIKAGAYERTLAMGKTHNFELALPEHLSEQAHEMLKSAYNLEFLGIRHAIRERDIEDRLIGRQPSSSPTIIPPAAWIRRQPTSKSRSSSRRQVSSWELRSWITSSSTGVVTSASWRPDGYEE